MSRNVGVDVRLLVWIYGSTIDHALSSQKIHRSPRKSVFFSVTTPRQMSNGYALYLK